MNKILIVGCGHMGAALLQTWHMKSKNNFVFCLSPDVEISKECFVQMLNIVHQFKDFTMLAPTYFDEKINKNYKYKILQP